MDNPEEVLHALDEFQKMRPSEIPRELEDYLCFVAKTGDPVYQWAIIKSLFREKLVRVMTDFYESCPTLDLTPCPNVEQFNYDLMKSSLLERLESFANAPFTVQRICELLTTPRKEYNRIDKFMRAIEKNILVVSTREPGPHSRRSENGDNLVNGSIEDEAIHHAHSSNEIEMQNWVKDCTVTTAIPQHMGDNEEISVENGLNSSIKSSFDKQQERLENQLSAADATVSSFVSSSDDFETATPVISQPPVQEGATIVQNLTTISQEITPIIGDVSNSIMNEDTSSQPSLELESDESDSSDSKKLPTTFQAKDFKLDEIQETKTYSEVLIGVESEGNIESNEPNKECDELTQSEYSSEKLLNESTEDLQNSAKLENLNVHPIVSEIDEVEKKLDEPQLQEESLSESESNVNVDSFQLIDSNLDVKKDDVEDTISDLPKSLEEPTSDIDVREENKTELDIPDPKSDVPDSSENLVESTASVDSIVTAEVPNKVLDEVSKPVIEEPLVETTDYSDSKTDNTGLTIEETTENETKAAKTMVPDPIPIIEEPKDAESIPKDWDSSASVAEVAAELKDTTPSINNGLTELPVKTDQVEDTQMVVTACEEATSNKGAPEWMDVDNEGLVSNAQQDEPMEQETAEPMNS